MGLPMVRRLVDAGHDVRAHARNDETRHHITASGALPVTELAEAADGADAVVLCVFTDDQVREVSLGTAGLLGPAGPVGTAGPVDTENTGAKASGALLPNMPAGSVLLVHTTAHPDTLAALAVAPAAEQLHIVDAPVSGGPHDIAAAAITVFVGGTPEAVERACPVLDSYADPILPVGPLGSGQRIKLVNNTLFAAQIGLVAEAVRLAEELGIDEATVLSTLPHASSAGRAMASIARAGAIAQFADSAGEFLGKDITVARSLIEALGADLGILDTIIDSALGSDRPLAR